jgi:ATP-dependent HslUV protease ATP-binding subunit HslU
MENILVKQQVSLTPPQIVAELDRFIVGQTDAKKAVAIALRNRWRRKNVAENLREEIVPKNILMIGPTGVGKTEIARRLAKLANAPFVKIEATKFTEVGYVGRDVDSIIRDLTEIAVNMVKTNLRKAVNEKAEFSTEERILDALVGESSSLETREKFRSMLKDKKLEDKEIEIEVQDIPSSSMPSFDIPGMPGSQMGVINIGDMINKALGSGGRSKSKKMLVKDAFKILVNEESDKLIEEDKIISEAINIVENDGIVFLDEIDKIAARNESKGGEVSREGVQRDLLPLIEGTTVTTKYGAVKTDHILFIASGAFHMAKPSDLLPELQGRLPIRVELKPLTQEDMKRILKEPEASLLKQYSALLKTEQVELDFSEDGIDAIARLATEVNRDIENIGARRLHTIMEKLLEEISFNASGGDNKVFVIDEAYVNKTLSDLAKQTDLSKFIL